LHHLISCISYPLHSWHHSNACIHSFILEHETPESEPVEPETDPGVEVFVEPEEEQGKQLSMFIPMVLQS
jgi:hypothetical protein